MSKQHVERCFDMSNVAVGHVAVFGNMSNDFFILSTCRNKLNMFNFFRHVERRMPQVACCFDMLLMWTGLYTTRPLCYENPQKIQTRKKQCTKFYTNAKLAPLSVPSSYYSLCINHQMVGNTISWRWHRKTFRFGSSGPVFRSVMICCIRVIESWVNRYWCRSPKQEQNVRCLITTVFNVWKKTPCVGSVGLFVSLALCYRHRINLMWCLMMINYTITNKINCVFVIWKLAAHRLWHSAGFPRGDCPGKSFRAGVSAVRGLVNRHMHRLTDSFWPAILLPQPAELTRKISM